MESSGELNINVIDPSVGGLVWVRRRNGSWWPGRIMGSDELPESCSVSPKTGTPVKLLGREDASIDWYNLEKSIRVKPFRCGEFDACIGKAKASAANSSRKVVKYARREDAIIHALELESARPAKDQPDRCPKMDKSRGEQTSLAECPVLARPAKQYVHVAEELCSFEDNSNSGQELSQSGVSFEETNPISASMEPSVQGRKRRTRNDSEDDGMEGIKRMRGLEDLGIGVVSSLKRKRSQVAKVQEFLKRKDRRRPLTKVLESTAMVSVPVMCEPLASPSGSHFAGVSDSKVSGLESNESKRSFSVVVNNNSDSTGISCENGTSLSASEQAFNVSLIKQKENEISSMLGLPEIDSSDLLFDVPFVGEEKQSAGISPVIVSSSQKPQFGAGAQSSQSSQVETLCLVTDEFNESGSTSSDTADIDNTSEGRDRGTSRWQLKGKRNSRHANKNRKHDSRRSVGLDDESNSYLAGIGSGWEVDCTPVNEFQSWRRYISHKEPQRKEAMPEMNVLPDWSPTPQRSLPYRQSRFNVNPRYKMSDFSVRNYGAVPCLYEVNLEVKSSYRPQHVPYISLMSKLNGQPIIGHPITIEVLDDGFCDTLISGPEGYLTSSSCELDDDMEENIYSLGSVDRCIEVKPNLGSRKISTKHPTLQSRVSPNKSSKTRKNGLLSNKKIRKLSSLTGSGKQIKAETKPVVEKLNGPALACVPLKIVFSRINAALNSKIRPSHRVLTSSN